MKALVVRNDKIGGDIALPPLRHMWKKVDIIVCFLVAGFVGFLNLLPLNLRIAIVDRLLWIVAALMPQQRQYALSNLEIAFPEKDLLWRLDMFRASRRSLARLIVDFARMPTIDGEWVREHVEHSHTQLVAQCRKEAGTGVIYATGHLGSFELTAHVGSFFHGPTDVIVRNFKNRALDEWWNARRELCGNLMIPREGAFNNIMRSINDGRNVGVLCDQNVRRGHAVFVDFFGRPAATTRTIGLAALKTPAPVLVLAMVYLGDERYRFMLERCEIDAIRSDPTLSRDKKVERITAVITKVYEGMVRQYPEQWFWMHRRWHTKADE